MATELELLIKKQRDEGLTDSEMGERLGVSRVHYNYIKNKRSAVNDKFIMKAYRAFPDIFLPNSFTSVKRDITGDKQDYPETSPNENLGSLWGRVKGLFKGIGNKGE